MWRIEGSDDSGEEDDGDVLMAEIFGEEGIIRGAVHQNEVELERQLEPAVPEEPLVEDEPLPAFDDVIAQLLSSIFTSNEADGEEKLRRHLSWAVPMCYKPRKNLSPLSKQQFHTGAGGGLERAKKLVFPVLEGILDKDKELSTYFSSLAASSTPSVCGKVFKSGELTYSCRDCGLDPTCVLCSACFQLSAHKTHRYRVMTSGGGGFCDCGDEEAWKTGKFCSAHEPKAENPSSSSSALPQPLENRLRSLLKLLLDYSFTVLNSKMTLALPPSIELYEDEPALASLPPSLKTLLLEELHCTVLFNDEAHTFDTVIACLLLALSCSRREATSFATIVDREGRAIIRISDFEQCFKAKQTVEAETSRHGALPLKTMVLQAHLVAHQAFAIHLLKWIQDLLEKSSSIRLIFGSLLETFVVDKVLNARMLTAILKNDAKLWKSARLAYHHLLITGMLKDYELKKRFASVFAQNYEQMIQDFVADDHGHSFSITSLSVQIFTVPSVALFLVESQDIISVLMGSLKGNWQQNLNAQGKLVFERGTSASLLKCGGGVLRDLSYILAFPPPTGNWSEPLITNFNRGLTSIIELLRAMQEMNPTTRQLGAHVEREMDWWPYFNLYLRLQPVLTLLFEWLRNNSEVLAQAATLCLRELTEEYALFNRHRKSERKQFGGKFATCLEFNVENCPVSFHIPLSRFVSGVILLLQKEENPGNLLEVNENLAQILLEAPLRVQLVVAQINAGMWRRNGYSFINQQHCYQDTKFRLEMMDKDVISLQLAASMMNPDEFCIHLLNRFGLLGWIEKENRAEAESEEEEEKGLLLSEFLSLIINLFAARFVPGVGMVEKKDCVRKEAVQLLCIEPMTHSALSKDMVGGEETGLEEVIEEVAVRKRGGVNNTTVFELREEFYGEYDWHHYHYTREQMSRAEGKQRERKKGDETFPPPVLPGFTPPFEPVVNILKSDVLLGVISIVLEGKNHTQSEAQLRKILHLIGHGLNEQVARSSFGFTEEIEKSGGVWEKLEELAKNPSMSQHLGMINWIRKRKEELHPEINGEKPAAAEEETQPKADERKQKAAEMRAKALAKITAAQQKFMAVNANLFEGENSGNLPDVVEPQPPQVAAPSPTQHEKEEIYACILCREEHPLQSSSKGFVLAALIQRSTVLTENPVGLRELELKNSSFPEEDDLWLKRSNLISPHVSSCGHIMHESCWTAYVDGIKTRERRRPFRHTLSFDVSKDEWLCPMCDCICNAALPMTISKQKSKPVSQEESITRPLSFSAYLSSIEWKINKAERDDEVEDPFDPDAPDPVENDDAPLAPGTSGLLNRIFSRGRKCLSPSSGFRRLFQRGRQLHRDVDIQSSRSPRPVRERRARLQNPGITTFMERIFKVAKEEDYNQDEGHSELHRVLWQSLAYSIAAGEAFHRDQSVSFFGENVPIRSSLGLEFLTRFCSSIFGLGAGFDEEASLVPSWLLEWEAVQFLRQIWAGTDDKSLPSMLELDAFGLLVFLTYLLPFSVKTGPQSLVGKEGELERFNLRLAFTIHVYQLLMLMEQVGKVEGEFDEEFPSNDESMRKFLYKIWSGPRNKVAGNVLRVDSDCTQLWTQVSLKTLPFLRCCAKFYESVTQNSPPSRLEQGDGATQADNLIGFLNLPTSFAELFDSAHVCNMVIRWSSHPSIQLILNSAREERGGQVIPSNLKMLRGLSLPRVFRSLAQLPEDYTELINSVSGFKCQRSATHDSRVPTMCLVCGLVLCSESYCCQQELNRERVGACTFHAHFCGGGVGLFLRIRECRMFLLNGRDRGCHLVPPYFDEYGETDEGLRRGNPLKLNRDKFEQLRKLWAQHGIPEEVSRMTENPTSFATLTNWLYL